MKNLTKIALTVALISGASAMAMGVNTASARGWGNGPAMGAGMGPAQGQRFDGPRGFLDLKALDTDKDGTLTKEELTAGLGKKITDNDTNSDNAVSLEEFKTEWMAMTKDRMVRAFQRFDRDGDGKVTLEEFSAPATAQFDRLDANNDGKIDNTDRQARQAQGPRGNWGQRDGRWGGGPRGGQFKQGQYPQGQFQQGKMGPQFGGQFGPQGGPMGGPGMMGGKMRGPHGGQFQMGQYPQGNFGQPMPGQGMGQGMGQGQMGPGQPAPAPQLAPTADNPASVAPQAPDAASLEAPVLPPIAMVE
ncbi:EF-hand domain-containing protein [Cohaesibacter haloalkalitolerans]|uniref:EF-hand domain-containing protein n=1 Tax=Cohaesibacter haloalkalitolerans TaxID=1162980 RepID=UPI0013C4795B|nr:EF-hand domain-containing protein [Cohaesibacter haloalkalitolerans]